MPWLVYVLIAAWALVLIVPACAAGLFIWREWREGRAGEMAEVIDMQRSNPRGVGRRDWPA